MDLLTINSWREQRLWALLAGYAYAHLLAHRFDVARSALVHLAVLGTAALTALAHRQAADSAPARAAVDA